MINTIKNMINEKKEFITEASAIYEDASGMNLDDIILGDSETYKSFTESGEDEDPNLDNEPIENEEGEESPEQEVPVQEPVNSSAPFDEDEPINNTDSTTVSSDEPTIENEPIEPASADEPLPSNQDNQGVVDPLDDILDTTLSLKSNTVTDVLPIPPNNAGEAIADSDDIMNQRIDSGFGGESESTPVNNEVDILDQSIEAPAQEEHSTEESGEDVDILDQPISEAITLGSESTDNQSGDNAEDVPPVEDTSTEEPAADDGLSGSSADGNNTEETSEENDVTAAVRDKVEESEMDDGVGSDNAKELLLKKLGSLTKNIEDTKKAIIDKL